MGNRGSAPGKKSGKVPKKVKAGEAPVDTREEAEKRTEASGMNFEEYPKRMRMAEEGP